MGQLRYRTPSPSVIDDRDPRTRAAPSPNTWEVLRTALRDWLVFLGERGACAFEQSNARRSPSAGAAKVEKLA